MPHRRALRAVWSRTAAAWAKARANLAVIVLVASVVVNTYLFLEIRQHQRDIKQTQDVTRTLVRENRGRLIENEREARRICRQGYETVRDIFRPFFAGADKQRVRRFNRRVNAGKARCNFHRQEGP